MKNANKKLIAILIVIGLALIGYGVYNLVSPSGDVGNKEVTINVIAKSENIDFTEKYKTNEEFLEGLLVEKKDELNVISKDSEFGPMILGLKGYQTDATKEYFNIKVNGVDAMTGVKEIPLKDGDVYTFEVKGF